MFRVIRIPVIVLITSTLLIWNVALSLGQGGVPNHPKADSGPGVPLVKAFLDAYNKPDLPVVLKMISPEIVFLDDDGHTNLGKDFVAASLQRRLATPVRESLVPSGPITSSGSADVVWASFPYTFDRADIHRKGLITMVFQKAGADWQIVHFQFAIDQLPANSLDRR
jgi:ketosteroid isomerase-like protein